MKWKDINKIVVNSKTKCITRHYEGWSVNDGFDKSNSTEIHWVALCVNINKHDILRILTALALNRFHWKLKKLLTTKISKQISAECNHMTVCSCHVQSYDLIICGYVCIGFVDFICKGKSLTLQSIVT